MKEDNMNDKQRIIEVDGVTYVPYIILKAERTSHKKEKWRMFIAFLLTIIAIFGIFMFAWCQYETVDEVTTTEYEYSQDGEGINNINYGTQGDMTNEPKTDSEKNNSKTDTP